MLAVHVLVPLHPLGVTLGVVRDGWLGVARRLWGEEVGAERPGVDDARNLDPSPEDDLREGLQKVVIEDMLVPPTCAEPPPMPIVSRR